jgi:hypothetical protein
MASVRCTILNACSAPRNGNADRYNAPVRRIGIDFGAAAQSGFSWAVFAPTRLIGSGELAGNYAGPRSAWVAMPALVGGSNNTMARQSLSLEGQAGLNVAIGVGELELRYERRPGLTGAIQPRPVSGILVTCRASA